ncbi:MAG: hypothetical protein DI536_09600 [Archangium gephyra]|uniref:Uncharacterized protein n=1 Tax=Archangium gephyra TaxID=48 RepID=A0A2W5VWK4_9BACT|nr:MAG: hypothetical protein DI536_09600 [Archangium gephyra]
MAVSTRQRQMKGHAAWLAMAALALMAPPRLELPESHDGATMQRVGNERRVLAMPEARFEHVVSPVKLAPRPMHPVNPSTSTLERAVSEVTQAARPVERGAWRGVKWARLRACPPQGPPTRS